MKHTPAIGHWPSPQHSITTSPAVRGQPRRTCPLGCTALCPPYVGAGLCPRALMWVQVYGLGHNWYMVGQAPNTRLPMRAEVNTVDQSAVGMAPLSRASNRDYWQSAHPAIRTPARTNQNPSGPFRILRLQKLWD